MLVMNQNTGRWVLTAAWAVLMLGGSASRAQEGDGFILDASWTITVNGKQAQPNPDGSFKIRNVSAADLFGLGGPGTAPDFRSDDAYRVTGTRMVNGMTQYVYSNPFRINQGQRYRVNLGALSFGTTPPPFPKSIAASASNTALTLIGETSQMQVIGTLADGSLTDLTVGTAWTTYRTSSLDVLTVDADGLVTAAGPGFGVITATNNGATSTVRFSVLPSDSLTTVMGFVQLEDGTPVADATVDVLLVPGGGEGDLLGFGVGGGPLGTGTSGPDGSFSIPGLLATLGDFQVRAELVIANELYSGSVQPITPIAGGITDAGIIPLVLVPCQFETSPGTGLNQSDDDLTVIGFTGGFSFTFFGVSYNEVVVNSNGNLTFGGGDTTYDPQPLPDHVVNGLPRISLAFVDFNPGAGGDVFFEQFPERFVVTWAFVPLYSSGGINTLQVILNSTGRIDFVYNSMTANGTQVGADDQDISVAISPGGTPTVMNVNYDVETPFSTTGPAAIYENFNPSNLFDLDFQCLVFQPNANGGYDVQRTVLPGEPQETGEVRGRVRGEDGQPLSGQRVTITSSANPAFAKQVITDARGGFRATDVPAPGGINAVVRERGRVIGTASGSLRSRLQVLRLDVVPQKPAPPKASQQQ